MEFNFSRGSDLCRACVVVVCQSSNVAGDNLYPTPFRVGERLTYTVSFEKYADVAFAEIAVVLCGRSGDRDAVELLSRLERTIF